MPSRASELAVISVLLGSFAVAGCVMESADKSADPDLGVASQAVSFAGHDYLFVTTPKGWHQAQESCFDYAGGAGYHLVTINDAAEEAFLNNSEARKGLSRWWIGYTDEGHEGTWEWATDASNFANWAPGQPDNLQGTQNCAVDRFNGGDGWDDLGCTTASPFICERESEADAIRGSFFYSTTNTSNATVNSVQHTAFLIAGQAFTAGTCGVPGASGTGDTYLRLKNPSGGEIAANDDSFSCGLLSNLAIVAPTTGTYVIQAGCFGSDACTGTVTYNY
jgi:hypothetical protein